MLTSRIFVALVVCTLVLSVSAGEDGNPYAVSFVSRVYDAVGGTTTFTYAVAVAPEGTDAPSFALKAFALDFDTSCGKTGVTASVPDATQSSADSIIWSNLNAAPNSLSVFRFTLTGKWEEGTATYSVQGGETGTEITSDPITGPTQCDVAGPNAETLECDAVPVSYGANLLAESGTCENAYTLREDCDAEDNCKIVSVVDTTPPVFESFPSDEILTDCTFDFTSPAEPTVVDNCDSSDDVHTNVCTSDPHSGSGGQTVVTNTWTAIDNCGNTFCRVQVITCLPPPYEVVTTESYVTGSIYLDVNGNLQRDLDAGSGASELGIEEVLVEYFDPVIEYSRVTVSDIEGGYFFPNVNPGTIDLAIGVGGILSGPIADFLIFPKGRYFSDLTLTEGGSITLDVPVSLNLQKIANDRPLSCGRGQTFWRTQLLNSVLVLDGLLPFSASQGYTPDDLNKLLETVENFALIDDQFFNFGDGSVRTRLLNAYQTLHQNWRTPVARLVRALLVAELNTASGRGFVALPKLQHYLIRWAEFVVRRRDDFERDYIFLLRDALKRVSSEDVNTCANH